MFKKQSTAMLPNPYRFESDSLSRTLIIAYSYLVIKS